MADRYPYNDRSRQNRDQRYGQAEQFQSDYDRDDRSQMGEGWRGAEYGQQGYGGSNEDRYRNRDYGTDYRQGGSEGYGAGSQGYGPSSYGSSPYDRSDRGQRSSGFDRDARHAAQDARETFADGAGSQLARQHGEWHDNDRSSATRSYGQSPSSNQRGNEGGFLERAGSTIAGWLGDGSDTGRGRDSHRGRGPANYSRSDERVLEDACDALTQDHWVDARNVQVTVQNGDVTLDGTVSSREEKRRAEDCVDNLSGVKHVQNNLRVQQQAGSSYDRSGTSSTGMGDSSATAGSSAKDVGTTGSI